MKYKKKDNDHVTLGFFFFTILVYYILYQIYFLSYISFSNFSLEPSKGCGPFRIHNNMYNAITTTVDGWPKEARTVYNLLISPAVTGPIIIFLL